MNFNSVPKKNIIKGIASFLIILVMGFVLHTGVFSHFVLGVVTPNVMLLVTAAMGFMRSKNMGMIMGFCCGILMDCYYPEYFGLNCLIFLVIGYLNGIFASSFYGDDIRLPLLLIAGSDIIYGVLIYLFLFLLRGRTDIVFYLLNIILPEAVYTILVFLLLYFPILKILRWADSDKDRGRNIV